MRPQNLHSTRPPGVSYDLAAQLSCIYNKNSIASGRKDLGLWMTMGVGGEAREAWGLGQSDTPKETDEE